MSKEPPLSRLRCSQCRRSGSTGRLHWYGLKLLCPDCEKGRYEERWAEFRKTIDAEVADTSVEGRLATLERAVQSLVQGHVGAGKPQFWAIMRRKP